MNKGHSVVAATSVTCDTLEESYGFPCVRDNFYAFYRHVWGRKLLGSCNMKC